MLNRDDVGQIAKGKAADLAVFDLNQVAFAGAQHDPVAALIFCQSVQAAYTIVNGRILVREGRLETVDLQSLLGLHNRLAAQLVGA